MICTRIKESVFMHAHGELRGVSRVLVEQHLSRCPACRARCQDWAHEEDQWRATLGAQPGLNGSAQAVRLAIAARIRAEGPPAGVRRTPAPRPRKLLLVAGAVALALTLSALGAFGPTAAREVHRLWNRATRRPVDCDTIVAPLRTPAGGQENSPTASPASTKR